MPQNVLAYPVTPCETLHPRRDGGGKGASGGGGCGARRDESWPLGRLMSLEGLQAKLTGTGNNKVRRYTFDLKVKIKGMPDSDKLKK